MLSAVDLASMQATMVASLPDVCEIVGDTLTSDSGGGHTAAEGAPATVACRVSPLRLTRSSANAETVEVERVVEQSLWLITMAAGTVVTPTKRVKHQGRAFEVVEVLSPRSWNLATRVSCKLVNSGEG